MGAYLVQVLLRVPGEDRQHLRLPGGGPQDHAPVGVQAPAPPRLVDKGGDALPPKGFHELRELLVSAPARGLHGQDLLQAHTTEDIRLDAAYQGVLQGGRHGGRSGVNLAYQIHRQPLDNVRLLPGEGGGVGVAGSVLCRRLRDVQGLPGLWVLDVELPLNHPGDVGPGFVLQAPEDGLDPLQGRFRVVVHQAPLAQAGDLIDNIRLRLLPARERVGD